jgi:hypothetical protein
MNTATQIIVGVGILLGGLLCIGLGLALVLLLMMRAGWRAIQAHNVPESEALGDPVDQHFFAWNEQVTRPVPQVRRSARNAAGPLYRRPHVVPYRRPARKETHS